MTTEKPLKNRHLRNNEYYQTQSVFDTLYTKSKENGKFDDLLPLITSEANIRLAYRNIKRNKGSHTRGVNRTTILDIAETQPDKLCSYVRGRLSDFHPHPVRRVEIEKDNGKKRPLGIPTIEDRLIQQCIKQVLEPICEAKFHKHSYGFRPNRSIHHAVARATHLMNIGGFTQVVDIDIKGFFDNVNHGKLLKQMWSLGIRDKNLLSVISKMLKAEIKGEGIPTKGVPQGGILSPLLSNIVLNELDWWLSNQWETHPTRKMFVQSSHKFYALRKTGLKEFFMVRYADDFKILCKTKTVAKSIFTATQMWLDERLGLEISPEKSKIVNLKKNYSEFLGFKIKLVQKADRWVTKSHMRDKAMQKCADTIRRKIKAIESDDDYKAVQNFNSTVLSYHTSYRNATHVSQDFKKIAFQVKATLQNCIRKRAGPHGSKSEVYRKNYGRCKAKMHYIAKTALFPVSFVQTKPPSGFTQSICNYTPEGRTLIHDSLRCVSPRCTI